MGADVNITASDRKALIRLASALPKGSEERKTVLREIEKTAAPLKFMQNLEDYLDLVAYSSAQVKGDYKPLARLLGRLSSPRGSLDDAIFRSGYIEDLEEAIERVQKLGDVASVLEQLEVRLKEGQIRLLRLVKELRKRQGPQDHVYGIRMGRLAAGWGDDPPSNIADQVDMRAFNKSVHRVLANHPRVKSGLSDLYPARWYESRGRWSLLVHFKTGRSFDDAFVGDPGRKIMQGMENVGRKYGLDFINWEPMEKGWGDFRWELKRGRAARRTASEIPNRLFDLVLALTRDEADALWHSPNDSEYRKANRELNQLLMKIQKDYGEDALDEALDGVATAQELEVPNATVRRNLPQPKRPRWASAMRSDKTADRREINKSTASLLKDWVAAGVRDWERVVSKFYLNDLSKAYDQIHHFERALSRMQGGITDLYADYIQHSDYEDFYDELTDAGFYDLESAIEEAKHDLTQMIDKGWADDGYEDRVQEEIEDHILPALEKAMDRFKREYGRPPRVASMQSKTAGGTDFWDWGQGSDPRKVFSELRERARHEYGHGGYSGSIAEKDGFKIRSREKMSTKEAEAFANRDIDNNDKWGPAFAIPSGNGWLFYGIAST